MYKFIKMISIRETNNDIFYVKNGVKKLKISNEFNREDSSKDKRYYAKVLDAQADEYKCESCGLILDLAVQSECCGTLFCRKCFHKYETY